MINKFRQPQVTKIPRKRGGVKMKRRYLETEYKLPKNVN